MDQCINVTYCIIPARSQLVFYTVSLQTIPSGNNKFLQNGLGDSLEQVPESPQSFSDIKYGSVKT